MIYDILNQLIICSLDCKYLDMLLRFYVFTYVFEIMSVIHQGEEDKEARRKPIYSDIISIVGPM